MPPVADCELPTTEDLVGAHVSAIRDQASALCRLPRGWDLGDAAAISTEVAATAVRVAARITCPECLPPVLSPTIAGHVLLDWTWGADHIEIEVSADGRLEVLVGTDGVQHEFETTIDNDLHLHWIAWQVTAIGVDRFNAPS